MQSAAQVMHAPGFGTILLSMACLLTPNCDLLNLLIMLLLLTPSKHTGLHISSHHSMASCLPGQGKEHAKWSPVATAWYKLLPEIVISKVLLDCFTCVFSLACTL